MTIEQLKQFVSDRIYTNNNFEVSALDVQEAINQVIDELFARETPNTPTLQQVLDEGNSANLESLINIVLNNVNSSLQIETEGVYIQKTDGGESYNTSYTSNGLSVQISDDSSFNQVSINPFSFLSTESNPTFNCSRNNVAEVESWIYSNSSTNQSIEKRISSNLTKISSENTDSGESYNLYLTNDATVYEISAGDDISSKISIHKADTVNTTNGTRGLVLTTKISADQTNDTEAAICIDGDLQIIDIEEEVVTDYSEDQDILIKDSNGVVKTIKNQNSPFIINEVLVDSDVTSGYDANLFDFILVEGSSSQVDILLPSVLFDSYGYKERNLVFYVSNTSSQNVLVRSFTGIFDTLISGESAEYRYHTIAGQWVVISSNRV